VVLEANEVGIVLRTDAHESEVFANDWRSYLQRNPQDLQIVVTQDRIYLEKIR
jgi:hypothetical protein